MNESTMLKTESDEWMMRCWSLFSFPLQNSVQAPKSQAVDLLPNDATVPPRAILQLPCE